MKKLRNLIWKVVPNRYIFIAWGVESCQEKPWWVIRLSNHVYDLEYPQEYLTLFPEKDLNLYFQVVMRIDELEEELKL
jgi:hypothetical protein